MIKIIKEEVKFILNEAVELLQEYAKKHQFEPRVFYIPRKLYNELNEEAKSWYIPNDEVPRDMVLMEGTPVSVFDEIPNQAETRPKKYWEGNKPFSKY